jgi:exopolysaccharide biosynthesis polyprenyl glycosylphosphotransferase
MAGAPTACPAAPATPDPLADALSRVVARRYAPRDARIRRALAVADVAAVVCGLAYMALTTPVGWASFALGVLTLPGWVVLFKAYGLYDRELKRIGHGTLDDVPWIFHALLTGSLLIWLTYRVAGSPVAFTQILHLALGTGVSVLVLRSVARRAAAAALGRERVLLVGDGEELAVLAAKMRAHPEYDVEPVGFVSRGAETARRAGLPVLGRDPADLEAIVRGGGVERVVIAHSDVGDDALLDTLRRCRELHVKASVVPQLFDVMGPSVEIDDVEGMTMLGIVPPVFPRSSRFLKRAMDVCGAGALLLLTAPMLAAIALAIRLDSRGPVLFRQRRIGRGGRPFWLFKFRTMGADAEQRHAELQALSQDPDWLKLDHDPRITRVGRLLRLSSLDELPQLWNVLRGEMSLVGPRPLIESEDRRLDGWRRSRVDLTPGLTGLWQVLGRTRIPFEEMVKLDYLYVTNWSLWSDVRLMLRTLPAVVTRRGAN